MSHLIHVLSQIGSLHADEIESWVEVASFLRAASVVAGVQIDIDALDPHGAGMWCRPAADYGESEEQILSDYFHALTRYYFTWSAYEAARDGTALGKVMKSQREDKAKAMRIIARAPLDGYPLLRSTLIRADSLVRHEEGGMTSLKLGAEAPPINTTAKLRTLSQERLVLEQAALLLREFRHYAFHGDEQPPSPDESPDHFRGPDGGWVRSVKAERMEAMTQLALITIQVFVLSSRASDIERIPGHELGFISSDLDDGEFDLPDVLVSLNYEEAKICLLGNAML